MSNVKKIELVSEDGESSFYREIIIENVNDRTIVGVGFPYMWEYGMLKEYPPKDHDRLYIDASGRNFGTACSVYCSYSEFMSSVSELVEDYSLVRFLSKQEDIWSSLDESDILFLRQIDKDGIFLSLLIKENTIDSISSLYEGLHNHTGFTDDARECFDIARQRVKTRG